MYISFARGPSPDSIKERTVWHSLSLAFRLRADSDPLGLAPLEVALDAPSDLVP